MYLVLLLMCGVLSSISTSAEENVIVTTSQGMILGFQENTIKGKAFYSFHSIPYVEPPIGNLRLKDPVPHKGWSGVRNGSVIPPLCAQIPWFAATKRKPIFEGDEDCLYLSVFTDRPNDITAKKPVMLFIHGGAFFAGGGSLYTPYVFMDQDIVFIIIQYRLGMLGFLSTEDDIIPGNFGLKDQVMALRWVQDNIEYFGGDKNRVTIFGESAGGASVHFHVLSPKSDGLFTRGILQSGTLFCPWAMGGAYQQVAKFTGKLFDCPSPESLSKQEYSEALLDCLQKVDLVDITMSLMNHIHWNYDPVLLGPRVDREFIPDDPEILMKEGKYNKVDIISGVNSHEGGLFASPLYGVEELKFDLLNNFDEFGPASLDIEKGDSSPVILAQKIFDYYVGGVKAELQDADNICKMYGDWQFAHGHDTLAKFYTHNKTPKIYLYELNHRGQRFFGHFYTDEVGHDWVSHVDELFYEFAGNEKSIWKNLEREEDLKLRDIITGMWYNFAATGNPTPDDSLGFIWEATDSKLHHLSLNLSPIMAADHRAEGRKFLESLPTKQNKLLHPEMVVPLTDPKEEKEEFKTDLPRKYSLKDEL